jgi:hypothetical protein
MTQYIMHEGSYSLNTAHTSLKLRYDPSHYPGETLQLVSLASDTLLHGTVDPTSPSDVTAIVYLPASQFSGLVSALQTGQHVIITLTCDSHNSVTAFNWTVELNVAKVVQTVGQTSLKVAALEQFDGTAEPGDIRQQFETILGALLQLGQQMGLHPSGLPSPRAMGTFDDRPSAPSGANGHA